MKRININIKKILIFFCIIILIKTNTICLISCNKNIINKEYTKEELKKLKEKNKIKTNNQEIRNNLEGITPQEKPFNIINNKGHFVVWKPNNTNFGKISKFKNDTNLGKKIDDGDPSKKYDISIFLGVFENNEQDLLILDYSPKNTIFGQFGSKNKGKNFKSVYRGNLNNNKPDLIIDNDQYVKINE